jgi:hypothetical protein
MTFTQFKIRKQLVKRFSTNIQISDIGVYTPPAGYTLLNVSTYLENARITSHINRLAITNTDSIDDIEDPDKIKSALIDILFHSPRKELNISIVSDGITILLGTLSLINNGFPYNYHSLDDIINNQLSLDNISSLKLDFIDVGYGLMIQPDYCLLQGDIIQEITLFRDTPNIINNEVSPIISIPTPTINLNITGLSSNSDNTPTPTPTPTPTIEDAMKVLKSNNFYQTETGFTNNDQVFISGQLVFMPFFTGGYDLTAIASVFKDMQYNTATLKQKLAVYSDFYGQPDLKLFESSEYTLALVNDAATKINIAPISTAITGKKLVWIAIASNDDLYSISVTGSLDNGNNLGYDFANSNGLVTLFNRFDSTQPICYTSAFNYATNTLPAMTNKSTLATANTGIVLFGKLTKPSA